MKQTIFITTAFLINSLLTRTTYGQAQRLSDHNAIGWYVYNGDHKISQKWEVHTEYQWRRVDLIRIWQQSLARLGLNYKLSDKVKVSGGYTYFVTFPYGRYPQAEQGVPYPEHRIYEDVQFKSPYGRLSLTHRFRLEQRWLGQLDEQNPRQVNEWQYQNRVRYQVAGVIALKGDRVHDGEFYLNFFDELFIGFGQNVEQNIFNQNRISGGLGFQVRDNLKFELNYLNQIVQHAEPDDVSGRPVFEYNNGFRMNVIYNIDFTGKSSMPN